MERATVSLEEIDKALHNKFTKSLGRDATDQMMRVKYVAADGKPNWNASIGSAARPVAPSVLSAFNEALARVRARYQLRDAIRAQLPRA